MFVLAIKAATEIIVNGLNTMPFIMNVLWGDYDTSMQNRSDTVFAESIEFILNQFVEMQDFRYTQKQIKRGLQNICNF